MALTNSTQVSLVITLILSGIAASTRGFWPSISGPSSWATLITSSLVNSVEYMRNHCLTIASSSGTILPSRSVRGTGVTSGMRPLETASTSSLLKSRSLSSWQFLLSLMSAFLSPRLI